MDYGFPPRVADPPATRNNPLYRTPARSIAPIVPPRRTADQVDGNLTHHPVVLDMTTIVAQYDPPPHAPVTTFKPQHRVRRALLSLASDARDLTETPIENNHTDVYIISQGQLRNALRASSDQPGVNPGFLVLSTAITSVRQKFMGDPDVDSCTMFVSITSPSTSLFGTRSTGAPNELCFEPMIAVCPTNGGSGPSAVFDQIGAPIHVDHRVPFEPRVFRSPRQYWSPLSLSCVDAALTGTHAFMADTDKVRNTRTRGVTDLVTMRCRTRGQSETSLPVIRGTEELKQELYSSDYPHYAIRRYTADSQGMQAGPAGIAINAPSMNLSMWTSVLNHAMTKDGIADIQSSLIDLRTGGSSGYTHDTVLTIRVRRPAVYRKVASSWMVPQLSIQVELVGVLLP